MDKKDNSSGNVKTIEVMHLSKLAKLCASKLWQQKQNPLCKHRTISYKLKMITY